MKMHKKFWTFTEGFIKIAYDDTDALEAALKSSEYSWFLVEPIKEKRVYVPTEGYFMKAKALCAAHNVLFIADEVQTGIVVLEDY
jgi:ornithine--oxo-acid transaminase